MREAVISKTELERLLAAEFPETFNPGTGLVILEIWHGGCRLGTALTNTSTAVFNISVGFS